MFILLDLLSCLCNKGPTFLMHGVNCQLLYLYFLCLDSTDSIVNRLLIFSYDKMGFCIQWNKNFERSKLIALFIIHYFTR